MLPVSRKRPDRIDRKEHTVGVRTLRNVQTASASASLQLHAGKLSSRLDSSSSRDDFNKLLRNSSLARAVESDGQLLNHLAGVLGRIVHSRHARRLLARRRLLQHVEQQGRVGELVVALQHVLVHIVVCHQVRRLFHTCQREQRQRARLVRHHRSERVKVQHCFRVAEAC